MTKQSLNTLAGVFGRCFVIAFAFQAIATVLWLLLSVHVEDINARLFGIQYTDVRLAAYYFFAGWKLLNISLFFVPWLGLKWEAYIVGE